MPIIVKDYEWTESDKEVNITVPLKGVRTNKVDIFSTENYIKVHYPPYLFECFLYAPVCDQKSAAQVGNGTVFFKLEKETASIWGTLQSADADDKQQQQKMREVAQNRFQERIKTQKAEKDKSKQEQKQFGVKQQMELDNKERARIHSIKEGEREMATQELEKWKELQSKLDEEAKRRRLREQSEEKCVSEEDKGKGMIFKEDTTCGAPLRQAGKIEVTFTARTFPTPSRESTAPQEDAWLKKQAESCRFREVEDADLTEAERNPLWMRDKGNNFFKNGDYLSAISAFSHAIRMKCNMPALFSNRGACHLKLGNYMKCVEDCSKALELLQPAVAQNAASRCRAHVRRGTALCQLELYVEGLHDYEAALKIDPDNQTLLADANRIRGVIQGSSQS